MKRLISAFVLAAPVLLTGALARSQTVTSNLIIGVDPANTVALFTTGNNGPVQFGVTLGSNMIFRLDNPFCTGACTGDLNYLRVTLSDFSQDLVITGGPGGTAHVDFQRPTLLIAGPVPMQTDGLQFIVPQGTEVSFTATISGTAHIGSDTIAIPSQIAGNRLATSSPMLIRLDANRQLMSFDAVFPFDFAAAGNIDNVDINVDVAGSIRVTGSGLAPFADLPPVAVATVPATETCGQPITLDASASTDGNGPADIAVYRWTKPDGTVIATGKIVQVTLPPGDQVVVLHVIDTQGIEGTKQFTVHVTGEPAPVFTATPAPVHAATCGAVSLTPPPATSACGFPVTVTSNAPSFFFSGRTVVTWTARTPSGLTATTTQLVVVSLGDNRNCCPPGTNVIVGTSNNDTLNGTAGRDCIIGLGGQDIINGNGGDDIISGGDGDDRISGGTGNDVINGGSGQDVINGDDGNDDVNGGLGDDQLFGNNGDDILNGGGNNDRCTGGAGFDVFAFCQVLDTVDVPTTTTDAFPVCQCHPSKCTDCTVQVQACTATAGCPTIIGCVDATPNCHQPNECTVCQSGLSQQAITAAANLASCLGGCL
jgi:hypothetical protein